MAGTAAQRRAGRINGKKARGMHFGGKRSTRKSTRSH